MWKGVRRERRNIAARSCWRSRAGSTPRTACPWLAETYGRPVVTVTVDTGGLDDAAAARARAPRAGSSAPPTTCSSTRARAYFDRVLRFLIAGNVRRGGVYPLCVGAERALQAQEVARAARAAGQPTRWRTAAPAAGNDQVRFEVALRALAPELEVLAPIRDQPQRARRGGGLPRRARLRRCRRSGAAYSINRGLWGITIGGRETLDSSEPLPEEAWVLTRGAFDRRGAGRVAHDRLRARRAALRSTASRSSRWR